MTIIPKILVGLLLLATAATALLRHKAREPARVFIAWPIVGGVILEVLLLAWAGFWSL